MIEKSILTIVGPTAVGKTSVAIAVAKKINGEIIGLDSRQIYKGMAVGTAQPSAEEMEAIPHHLVAIREPNEIISAGEYAVLVEEIMSEIRGRGKEPILCGGAGLYLEALTKGIFDDSTTDLKIRERLSKEYDKNPEGLLKKLQEIDPEYAEKVHINNKKRLVRALEIFEITGKSPTEHFNNQPRSATTGRQSQHDGQVIPPRRAGNQPFCVILLFMVKQDLEGRIRTRTKKMLEIGWIEETKALRKKYSVEEAHALDSIGYRQICQYLDGEYTLEELEEEMVVRTRQYAKRQLTWFRNRSNPIEIDINQFKNIGSLSDEIIHIWKKSSKIVTSPRDPSSYEEGI
ncbi:MAG: tRNA (adenosine(37)-N6)-dimethylallyltransferase MiaA [Candidatus Marinimicrobia bacterium]|nr:tRNA (adenosine(37)-N6)-dimethylallyltransferase MiaA [Candidatus Neomarinimicrobiota bacterium]